jgi:hypothetical protein
MAGIERSERRTPGQWAALVKEHAASGQSQRAFCAARGIGQSTLRYWRRRLGEETQGGAGNAGARLVPVRVCHEEPSSGGSGLTLVVGDGVRIEVAPTFDPATLKRVLAAVRAGA